MTTKRYVLRARMFAYDDEYYNYYDMDEAGGFCGAYTDIESATEAWQKHEQNILSKRPLYSVRDFIEQANEKLIEWDNFVFTRCGEHIIEQGESWSYPEEDCEKIIQKMNPADILAFVQMAGINSYQLMAVEFDEEATFYLRWLPEQQTYQYANDDETGESFLCCESSYEALLDSYFDHVPYEGSKRGYHYEEQAFILAGTLAELSHSPALLKTVIDNNPETVEYNEPESKLHLKSYQVFKQIYPLLAQPPFEVREVSIEQLNAILENPKN